MVFSEYNPIEFQITRCRSNDDPITDVWQMMKPKRAKAAANLYTVIDKFCFDKIVHLTNPNPPIVATTAAADP